MKSLPRAMAMIINQLDRDIQHPDISHTLSTGYPPQAAYDFEGEEISQSKYEQIIQRRNAEKGNTYE